MSMVVTLTIQTKCSDSICEQGVTMYTLIPCFKNLYTLQASFIFYHVAIRSYWDEINPSVYNFELKEQKKVFPLSKRQCDNFVARLLGHDSNSSVIALMNPNSKHS